MSYDLLLDATKSIRLAKNCKMTLDKSPLSRYTVFMAAKTLRVRARGVF